MSKQIRCFTDEANELSFEPTKHDWFSFACVNCRGGSKAWFWSYMWARSLIDANFKSQVRVIVRLLYYDIYWMTRRDVLKITVIQ